MISSPPPRRILTSFFMSASVMLAVLSSSAPPRAELERSCLPNRLLIRFEPGAVSFPQCVDNGHNHFTLPAESGIFKSSALRNGLLATGVETFTTVAPGWRHMTRRDSMDRHGNLMPLVDFTDVYAVTLDGQEPIEDALAYIRTLRGVIHAECDTKIHYEFTPDDEHYDLQWHLHNTGQEIDEVACDSFFDINAPAAWDIHDSAGTKIGICDQGIHKTHEDLASFIDVSLSKSFVDTVGGCWYDWWESCGHGTCVAGVAAAGTDNDGIGISGVVNLDPNHDDDLLVALKVGNNALGNDHASTVPRALSWVCSSAVYSSVLVVNFSLKTEDQYKNCHEYGLVLRDAFRNAFLKDISLICAAGRGGAGACAGLSPCNPSPDTCFVFPAAYPDYTLSVTGIDCQGNDCTAYQNNGSYVDITAPGWGIVTTLGSDDQYSGVDVNRMAGTSFSAPIVAGAIAMLLGKDSSLTNEDCYRLLEIKASPLEGYSSAERGHGLLRVDKALDALESPWSVQHGTVTTYSADSIDARLMHFRDVPILPLAVLWQECYAHVYELTATADLCRDGEVIVDTVWARGKTSTGWKNLDRYDAKFHANFAEFIGYGEDECEAILRTYTYKIYTKSTPRQFIGWAPFEPGEGPFNIDYSVISRPSRGLLAEAHLKGGGNLVFHARRHLFTEENIFFDAVLPGFGRYDLTIYDAAGRVVTKLIDSVPLMAGSHEFHWAATDPSYRRSSAGMYFARLSQTGQAESGTVTQFIVIR